MVACIEKRMGRKEGKRAEGCRKIKCKKVKRESAKECYKKTRAEREGVEQG